MNEQMLEYTDKYEYLNLKHAVFRRIRSRSQTTKEIIEARCFKDQDPEEIKDCLTQLESRGEIFKTGSEEYWRAVW